MQMGWGYTPSLAKRGGGGRPPVCPALGEGVDPLPKKRRRGGRGSPPTGLIKKSASNPQFSTGKKMDDDPVTHASISLKKSSNESYVFPLPFLISVRAFFTFLTNSGRIADSGGENGEAAPPEPVPIKPGFTPELPGPKPDCRVHRNAE